MHESHRLSRFADAVGTACADAIILAMVALALLGCAWPILQLIGA